MPNPYSKGTWFPNLGPEISNFADTLARLKMHQQDVDLRGRQLAQGEQQFGVMQDIRQQQLGQTQQEIGQRERQIGIQEAQLPPHKKNFGTVAAKTATNLLITSGIKKDNPFLEEINTLAKNPAVANQDAYMYLKSVYPSYRDNLRDEIGENFVSQLEKDPNYAKTPQGKKQQALLDALDMDETGDMVLGGAFAPTVRSMEMETAVRAATPALPQGFDQALGKLQGVQKTIARLESGMSEFGIPFQMTPNVEAALNRLKDIERKEISLIKKRFPAEYKDYVGEETGGLSDGDISIILQNNGYAVTPQNIETFRKNNPQ